MLEPKAPSARNGPNTESLAPGVKRRVNKKKKVCRKSGWRMAVKTTKASTISLSQYGKFGQVK